MSDEAWLPVVGYEGLYEVSDLGRVRRVGRDRGAIVGRILRRGIAGPYPQVALHNRDRGVNIRVHVLVARAFLPPRPTVQHEINHKDGDKRNNHAVNLEWMTHGENIAHAYAIGLRVPVDVRGEANPRAVVTRAEVDEARGMYANGGWSHAALARRFGIAKPTMGNILRGETWQ